MPGRDRDKYRPRRARDAEQESAPESPEPQESEQVDGDPAEPEQTADQPEGSDRPEGNDRPEQGTPAGPHPSSVEETVARARHEERVKELREHREKSGTAGLPERGDRPDVGRRRNVTLDQVAARPRRRGLRIGVVAVVVAAVLAAAIALYATRQGGVPTAKPSDPQTTAVAGQLRMVSSETLLTEKAATQIDDRSWTVQSDQPGDGQDAPVPACLSQPTQDQPQPTTSLVRTLTTEGSGPSALHRANAYDTPELATEAFALMAKALGECNLEGSYIESGRVINGLGDQATGVVLADPGQDSHRAVVLNRTGQVVNVIDVVQEGETPSIDGTAAALAQVTNTQCTIAVGVCASLPTVEEGPPPIGGDHPGFLAYADLPLPKNGKGTWGGLPPGSPADVVTSQCENVDFSEVTADNRTARSYVLTDTPKGMPDTFGIDEIILSMESEDAAEDLAAEIEENISECEDRQPTATVGEFSDVSGVGARDTKITGSVGQVHQQVTEGEDEAHYRVGFAVAGSKLIYTFLPYEQEWNVTRSQWELITVRAAQRATQVR